MSESELTHLDEAGRARMVDVGDKPVTRREAVAEALVAMPEGIVERVFAGDLPKGDAAAVARVAGIMGAKKTPELIPLCHPIPIESVNLSFEPNGHGVAIVATVSTTSRTGVEMEAMTAVAVAALTIYDMCKSVDRSIMITELVLWEKTGGRSGIYRRSPQE